METPPGLGPDGAINPTATKHPGRYSNTSFRVLFQERARALAPHAEHIAAALLGTPDHRDGATLRWGRKGSLALTIRGETAGLFFDHEAGAGGDVIDLIRHKRGGTAGAALEWAEGISGTEIDHTRPPVIPKRDAETDAGRTRRALALWSAAGPLAGSLALEYLRKRGLQVDEDVAVLRFHPSCPIRGERLPCMLALMADPLTGLPCGIQRTPMTPDARKHPLGRAMLGRAGVAMVTPDADVTMGLHIVEGVEDALAALAVGLAPVWATMSAGAMSRFPILPAIEALTVLADGDDAGRDAAVKCADRWREAGRDARVFIAPDGRDAAEVLT